MCITQGSNARIPTIVELRIIIMLFTALSHASICSYAFTLLSCVTCQGLVPGNEAKYTSPYLVVLFTLFGLLWLSPCPPSSPAAVLDVCMCVRTSSESVYEYVTMSPYPPRKYQVANNL